MLNANARFKHFKDLLHYSDMTSENSFYLNEKHFKRSFKLQYVTSENISFDVAAIHVGINDIINNKNSFSIDYVLQII